MSFDWNRSVGWLSVRRTEIWCKEIKCELFPSLIHALFRSCNTHAVLPLCLHFMRATVFVCLVGRAREQLLCVCSNAIMYDITHFLLHRTHTLFHRYLHTYATQTDKTHLLTSCIVFLSRFRYTNPMATKQCLIFNWHLSRLQDGLLTNR